MQDRYSQKTGIPLVKALKVPKAWIKDSCTDKEKTTDYVPNMGIFHLAGQIARLLHRARGPLRVKGVTAAAILNIGLVLNSYTVLYMLAQALLRAISTLTKEEHRSCFLHPARTR